VELRGLFQFHSGSDPADNHVGPVAVVCPEPICSLFSLLSDAREKLEFRQHDYNHQRPHSVLGNLTPMEFSEKKIMDKLAA